MAVRGPAPKPDAIRRNIRPTAGAPAAPVPAPPLEGDWPPAVHRWYATWASSPQARYFVATDWQRLTMLAPLVAQYLVVPKVTIMAELGKQETMLGATVSDRLRLNMQLDPVATSAAPASKPKPRRLKAV